jgi:hypothetical protein
MTTWVKKQFSDVHRARQAVLTIALVLGGSGFVLAMGALLAR